MVASLVERYQDYRAGREKLSVLGFLCLSALEAYFSGRPAVARVLNIETKVLSHLGMLVSAVGTYRSARKIARQHHLRDFTEQESFWLEAVIRELIKRAGAIASGRDSPTRLRLTDLPPMGENGE